MHVWRKFRVQRVSQPTTLRFLNEDDTKSYLIEYGSILNRSGVTYFGDRKFWKYPFIQTFFIMNGYIGKKISAVIIAWDDFFVKKTFLYCLWLWSYRGQRSLPLCMNPISTSHERCHYCVNCLSYKHIHCHFCLKYS